MAISRYKRSFYSLLGVVILLCIWKVISVLIGSEIILPSPEATLFKTVQFFGHVFFWKSLGLTLLRGISGFGISCVAGLIVGIAAGSRPCVHSILRPLLSTVKATPVMSIILIALIWFTAGTVPIFSAFLMAFPIVTGNIIQGIHEVPKELTDMANVFRVPKKRILFQLKIPSIFPYFLSGASTALGITWKVVIAAEVLSQPVNALGTGLYNAKIYLETAEVFAWTAVAIGLSAVTEAIFHTVLKSLRGAPVKNREGEI